MDNKLLLEIVTPHGAVYSEEVDEVTATGSEGDFGVLPGHAPFMTTLKVGMLTVKKGSSTEFFFIDWGYAEVEHHSVHILADSAEHSDDIDVERAQTAKDRAEKMLSKAEEIDFTTTQAALERALMRLQVAAKKSAR